MGILIDLLLLGFIGIVIPTVIRFAILRKPIDGWPNYLVVAINAVILFFTPVIVFSVFIAPLEIAPYSEYTFVKLNSSTIVPVSILAYFILRRQTKQKTVKPEEPVKIPFEQHIKNEVGVEEETAKPISKTNKHRNELKPSLKLVTVIAIVAVVGGLSYWFIQRPQIVRSACYQEFSQDTESLEAAIEYDKCLRSKGLPGDSTAINAHLIKQVEGLQEEINNYSWKVDFLLDAQRETLMQQSDYQSRLDEVQNSLNYIERENRLEQSINCGEGRYVGGGMCVYY